MIKIVIIQLIATNGTFLFARQILRDSSQPASEQANKEQENFPNAGLQASSEVANEMDATMKTQKCHFLCLLLLLLLVDQCSE